MAFTSERFRDDGLFRARDIHGPFFEEKTLQDVIARHIDNPDIYTISYIEHIGGSRIIHDFRRDDKNPNTFVHLVDDLDKLIESGGLRIPKVRGRLTIEEMKEI